MATDYYALLGVSRDASEAEIKKAFRKKAVELHPDHNLDDPNAEEEFIKVNEAYAVLSDTEKRASYDRFGAEGFSQHYTTEDIFRGTDFSEIFRTMSFSEDIFSAFGFGGGKARGNPMGGGFGGRGFGAGGPGTGGTRAIPKGENITIVENLSFYESVFGGEREIAVDRHDGVRKMTIRIPVGTPDGKRIRVRSEGQPSAYQGGGRGDLFIRVKVHPDPRFSRNGTDLTAQAFAPLTTLVLGGKLKVETMKGHKTVKIKAGTAPGSKIRIKGEGVPKRDGKRGNLYVTLQPKIPDELDEEQQALFEQLRDLGL